MGAMAWQINTNNVFFSIAPTNCQGTSSRWLAPFTDALSSFATRNEQFMADGDEEEDDEEENGCR